MTLASLNNSSYWKATFAWGRRVLTDAELVIPSPSPSPSPSGVGCAGRRAGCGWPGDADAGGARGVAHRHGDAGRVAGLRRSPDPSQAVDVRGPPLRRQRSPCHF